MPTFSNIPRCPFSFSKAKSHVDKKLSSNNFKSWKEVHVLKEKNNIKTYDFFEPNILSPSHRPETTFSFWGCSLASIHQSCNTVNCGDRLFHASKHDRIFPRLHTLWHEEILTAPYFHLSTSLDVLTVQTLTKKFSLSFELSKINQRPWHSGKEFWIGKLNPGENSATSWLSDLGHISLREKLRCEDILCMAKI